MVFSLLFMILYAEWPEEISASPQRSFDFRKDYPDETTINNKLKTINFFARLFLLFEAARFIRKFVYVH